MTISIDSQNLSTAEKRALTDIDEQISDSIYADTKNPRDSVLHKSREMIRAGNMYIHNYFSADNHFNTVYVSKVIRDKYFITVDLSYNLGSKIHPKWAVKEITVDGINTINSHALENLEKCIKLLREL